LPTSRSEILGAFRALAVFFVAFSLSKMRAEDKKAHWLYFETLSRKRLEGR
jgi:hypothetical protein